MNKFQEKQKLAMGGSQNPTFERQYWECKNGQFEYWNGVERLVTTEPIQGVILGKAFKAAGYDAHAKKFHHTNYYLNNKDVKFYDPAGKIVVDGSMDDVMAYTSRHLGSQLSKKQVIWIATKNGVVELRSNITLAIDQLNTYRWEAIMNTVFNFTPSLYTPQHQDVGAGAIKRLGALGASNPPSFFIMKPAGELTNDYGDSIGLEFALDSFIKWRKHYEATNSIEVEKESYVIKDKEPDAMDLSYSPPKDIVTPVYPVQPPSRVNTEYMDYQDQLAHESENN